MSIKGGVSVVSSTPGSGGVSVVVVGCSWVGTGFSTTSWTGIGVVGVGSVVGAAVVSVVPSVVVPGARCAVDSAVVVVPVC